MYGYGYYGYGWGIDPLYLLVILISLILGALTQAYINHAYKRWSKVPAQTGMTGEAVARRMLDSEGASACGITTTSGHLSDFYDPRDNKLHLSRENYDGGSVASVAVACHEAGHAVQTAKGYVPGRVRTALVPFVNLSQQVWGLVFILGIAFNMAGFVTLALLLFAISVVFQLVTLPVEIDASRRAVRYLKASGSTIDEQGARQVLTAAALTYVAAALMSIIQLLYLVARSNRRD